MFTKLYEYGYHYVAYTILIYESYIHIYSYRKHTPTNKCLIRYML